MGQLGPGPPHPLGSPWGLPGPFLGPSWALLRLPSPLLGPSWAQGPAKTDTAVNCLALLNHLSTRIPVCGDSGSSISPDSLSSSGQYRRGTLLCLSISAQADTETCNIACTPHAGCWLHVSLLNFRRSVFASLTATCSLQVRCESNSHWAVLKRYGRVVHLDAMAQEETLRSVLRQDPITPT